MNQLFERQAVLPRPVGREVRTLTAAVESMRRELEGRHLAERLAMDLSHQLKNPVAAIRATADRYRELGPLCKLIDQIEGTQEAVGYAFGRV